MEAPPPEPSPDFAVASKKWHPFWEIHIYVYGAGFMALTFFNAASLVSHWMKTGAPKSSTKKVFIVINVLLMIFNLSRGSCLLVDPYHSGWHFVETSPGYESFLFLFANVSVPCLTSAFALIHITFLEMTKFQLYSKKVQSLRFIFAVIAVHFTLVVGIDLAVLLHPEKNTLLGVCQVALMIIGILISISSIYAGKTVLTRVMSSSYKIRSFRDPTANDDAAATSSKSHDDVEIKLAGIGRPTRRSVWSHKVNLFDANIPKHTRDSLVQVTKITIATSLLGLMYSLGHVYSMTQVYDISDAFAVPPDWPWFAYHSYARAIELGMTATMSYIVRGNWRQG